MLDVTSTIQIPDSEFSLSFVRSSGPGGQNVNKVSTKAILRWNVRESPSLSAAVKARFVTDFGSRLTKDGELILQSQKYRDQTRNTEDCRSRLRDMLLQVASPPKKRRPSRRSRGSVERRLQNKKANSDRKQSRRRPNHED